jgi:hypothetical protein
MWCSTNARWVAFFYSPSADSDSVRRFPGDDLVRTVQCDGTIVTTFLERAGHTSENSARKGARLFFRRCLRRSRLHGFADVLGARSCTVL